MKARHQWLVCCLLVAGASLCLLAPAWAYIEVAMSLGHVVNQCSNVVLMRVDSVDKERKFIIYRKVRDLKGKHAEDLIKHHIGTSGLRADEWKKPLDWAEPGKMAVFFYNGTASETCIGYWWYQSHMQGEWWRHAHGEPFLLRSYAGSPEKLAGIVSTMLEGKEAIATCMVDGNKPDLHNSRAKIQRLKVSLELLDYNPTRDFVGWGTGKPDEEKSKKPADDK